MKSERIYTDYLEDLLDTIAKVGKFIQGVSYT
jgi:hypothetical protein